MKKIVLMAFCLIGFGQASATVEPTSGRYIKTEEDLSIQIIGGPLVWERNYRDKQWRFNRSWESLVFEYDTSSGQVRRILRGKDTYEKLDSAGTLFKFGPRMRIKKNADGSWTWKDRNGNRTEYAANGKTLNMHAQAGSFITLMYNGDDKLSGVKDVHDNQVLWITYDAVSGQIDAVKDYGDREVKYTWESISGSNPAKYKLTNVKDARGHDWQYSYAGSPATNGYVDLISMTDPELRETQIAYGGSGRVSSITNALGHVTSYQFDYIKARKEFYLKTSYPGGRVTEKWYARDGEVKRSDVNGINLSTITEDQRKDIVKDTFGRTTVMEYDEFRNLLKTTHPDGSSTSATYDVTNSNMLTQTDERGTVTRYEYFPNGRLKTMTEALGTAVERSTTYTYDLYGQLETLTQVGDAVTETALTQYFYDEYGNITSQIDAEGNEVKFISHDSMGNTLLMRDGRENEWNYSFDSNGSLLTEETPLNNLTTNIYNKVGSLIRKIHPDESFVQYEYDSLNRLTKVIDELGSSIIYEFDVVGNNIAETDKAGRKVNFKYDLLNRKTEVEDSSGLVVTYIYPQIGSSSSDFGRLYQPIKEIYPTFTKEIKYNLKFKIAYEKVNYLNLTNNQISEIRSYKYDLIGNKVEETNTDGQPIKIYYDELLRPIKILDAGLNEYKYHYDNRNNLLTFTNTLGHKHSFDYDRLNNQINETTPLGIEKNYVYNANNYITEIIDNKNQKIEYVFDHDNQNTEIKYYNLNGVIEKSVVFEYDNRGNMVSYDDGVSSGLYNYDKLQNKLDETVVYGNETFNLKYTYYADERKASYTGMDGIKYSYYYNENGQLNNVSIPNEGNISYQDFIWGLPQTIKYPGGVTKQLRYDGIRRLNSIELTNSTNEQLMSYSFSFNLSGNISEKSTAHGLYNYSYDLNSRLIEASNPLTQNEIFSYDSMGNRKTDVATGTEEWSYNQDNQLTDSIEKKHTYDENGSQIQLKLSSDEIENEFEYNLENRLTKIKDGSGRIVVDYYYDPFGRRLSKTVYNLDGTETTTYFHYSHEGLSSEKTNDEVISYLFKPGSSWSVDPILKVVNGQYYYYQNDYQGSPHLLLDNQGVIVNKSTMTSFGSKLSIKNTIKDPWLLPGQYYDEESGYSYNYHRYYDSRTGRYLKSDPIGLNGGNNLFLYANSNPIMYFDSLGLNCETVYGASLIESGYKLLNKKIDGFYTDWSAPKGEQKSYLRVSATPSVWGEFLCTKRRVCPSNVCQDPKDSFKWWTTQERVDGPRVFKDIHIPEINPNPFKNWSKIDMGASIIDGAFLYDYFNEEINRLVEFGLKLRAKSYCKNAER